MSIFAIGDLHLSFKEEKPMDIFGNNWSNHEQILKKNWIEMIKEDDLVIIPGDFSWATYLEDTYLDFNYLNELPGKKLLLKGNHDYWWTTIQSMNRFLEHNNFENITFMYNTSYEFEDYIIVGTRGWALTGTSNAEKMLNREVNRLGISIKDAKNKYGDNKELICAMHYPPISKQIVDNKESNQYIELMKENNIKKCIYGHLHGESHKDAVEGSYEGIEFKLVSSDYLNFVPYKLL